MYQPCNLRMLGCSAVFHLRRTHTMARSQARCFRKGDQRPRSCARYGESWIAVRCPSSENRYYELRACLSRGGAPLLLFSLDDLPKSLCPHQGPLRGSYSRPNSKSIKILLASYPLPACPGCCTQTRPNRLHSHHEDTTRTRAH